MTEKLTRHLEALGVPVVGPAADGIGYDGGIVVNLPVDHRKVRRLRLAGYRTCPTGPSDTIVAPAAARTQRGRPKRVTLVHYLSPFGSPAYMPPETAAKYLAQDEARWERAQQGRYPLSDAERAYGPPRIEPLPK